MTRHWFMIIAASLYLLTLPAPAAEKLSPEDIKATFATGTPFSAVTPGGVELAMTLNADGSALAIPKGKKKGNKGKWRLSDTGYCTKWGKSAEHCYTVQKNGDRYDVLGTSGAVVAHWTK